MSIFCFKKSGKMKSVICFTTLLFGKNIYCSDDYIKKFENIQETNNNIIFYSNQKDINNNTFIRPEFVQKRNNNIISNNYNSVINQNNNIISIISQEQYDLVSRPLLQGQNNFVNSILFPEQYNFDNSIPSQGYNIFNDSIFFPEQNVKYFTINQNGVINKDKIIDKNGIINPTIVRSIINNFISISNNVKNLHTLEVNNNFIKKNNKEEKYVKKHTFLLKKTVRKYDKTGSKSSQKICYTAYRDIYIISKIMTLVLREIFNFLDNFILKNYTRQDIADAIKSTVYKKCDLSNLMNCKFYRKKFLFQIDNNIHGNNITSITKFVNLKIKKIMEFGISDRYHHLFPKKFNKLFINNLKSINEDKKKELEEILGISFIDCVEYFAGVCHDENINRILFDMYTIENYKENENLNFDNEYKEKFMYILKNYKKILREKKKYSKNKNAKFTTVLKLKD